MTYVAYLMTLTRIVQDINAAPISYGERLVVYDQMTEALNERRREYMASQVTKQENRK